MTGAWSRLYEGLGASPVAYGSPETYALGAMFLEPCRLVEDWGCGMGYLREYVPPERYRGIDGTDSRFCDEVVDLETYRSQVPGVFMRHVLEHNHGWRAILDNALASFSERMVLVLFTPLAAETTTLVENDVLAPVPIISFAYEDIASRLRLTIGDAWVSFSLPTETAYAREHVFLLRRA